MRQQRLINLLWLVLVILTLAGALFGDTAEPGSMLLLLVVAGMALKGRLVIDYFMEMRDANRTLRKLMRAYFYVLPLMTVVVYLFGDAVAWLFSIR